MPSYTPSAHDVATRLVEQAPDEKWLRTLIDDLDQRIRSRPLERLLILWSLSAAQGAQLFGISRQAFMKWLKAGPPAERSEAIAALAAATDLLDHHLKRERIPAVVRRKAPELSGKSLLELAIAGEYTKVRSVVETMFDLRRIQP
jgi:sulfite reductase alpha subunit-like flavoprotein